MLVTVFCAPRGRPETTFALDVSPELELRDFVALCELESGIPAGEIQITYVEQPLNDLTRALGTYGIKDGDVVVLRQTDRRPPSTQPAFPGLPRIDFRSITVPGSSSSNSQQGAVRTPQQPQNTSQPSMPMAFQGSSPQGLDNPALLQQMLLSNPHELSLLKERNPPLAEALLSGDLDRFTKVLLEQQQDRAKREQERIRLLTADPFDLEAQAKIEEDIRQHNVEENMNIAMEEAPESFGQVVMLYINCKVNGHPVKAFVDSGAQMTIMSQACAERCNIMRLVDRRWAGIAKGVGTQKIIGRVHLAQVQIEGDFLPCSFSILEDQPMDMLLGLDMLKRHQCSIDLKKNVLLIGTTGTETRFLSEAELPECARLAYGAEGREDARPDELADRELAEALQRSIHESGQRSKGSGSCSLTKGDWYSSNTTISSSFEKRQDSTDAFGDSGRGPNQPDPADGQTTSQQPPPFTLPRTLDQMSSSTLPSQSSSSGQAQTLDRSQSAPATMTQASAPGPCHDRPSPLEPPLPAAETAGSKPQPVEPHPLPPVTSPSTDVLHTFTPSTEATTLLQDQGIEVQLGAAEGCPQSGEVVTPTILPHPEDLSPIQAMEQEATESDTAGPTQPDLVEMEPPVGSQGALSAESKRDSEREHHSSSDSIPSLAAALMELHELLLSNNQTQSQSHDTSCSPSHPFRPEAKEMAPEPCTPTLENTVHPLSPTIAAGAEPSDAKANHTAAVSDEGPSNCTVPDLSDQCDHLDRDTAETVAGERPMQCPDGPRERKADGQGQDEACKISICQPKAVIPPVSAGDMELKEPSVSQQQRPSGSNSPETLGLQTEHTLSPSPVVGGSPEEVSSSSTPPLPEAPQQTSLAPLLPSPHPFIEQFPAEHIQRIQAAGFSAREAAEALERANGVVELALLALLARSITVPT